MTSGRSSRHAYPEKERFGAERPHKIGAGVEARQVARTREVRRRRDSARVAALLHRLEREAREASVNLMPVTIELVRARATLGEIVARLRQVFGAYVERPVF